MKIFYIAILMLSFLCISACGEETEQEKMKNKLLAEGFGPLTAGEKNNQDVNEIIPDN